MTKYNDDFQSRHLYTQSCVSEEGPQITSSIYVVRWTYPGATQPTTARLRLTCVFYENPVFKTAGGSIERWTDKGWVIIDEYCDENGFFISESEFRDKLLKMSHAFIMGIPIEIASLSNKSSRMIAKRKMTIPKKTVPVAKKTIKEQEKKSVTKIDDDDDDMYL